jgi:hypothetical protein
MSVNKVEGGYDNGSAVVDINGEDAVVIKLKNNTSSTIQKFTILVLFTDENRKGCKMGLFQDISNSYIIDGKVVSYSNCVEVMGTESANLKSGTEEAYAVQCDMKCFENVNVIVYSYVDSTGKEIVNENYEEWLKNTSEIAVY